jgi:hypothetical protein
MVAGSGIPVDLLVDLGIKSRSDHMDVGRSGFPWGTTARVNASGMPLFLFVRYKKPLKGG